jgi:hypothetical protein
MLLAHPPARLEWSELRSTGHWQKLDPVQHHRDFDTVATAARYAVSDLPYGIGRTAIIRLRDETVLYWETWRIFCEAGNGNKP